ncbi:bifunctional diguanylate cyclase/phosphodiesterase [Marinimicrobium agarilyticum]|uniref:bifunctional diguanylate cyclase/phosphodiesterase n=1 Tax=Marinimicrobium agarilyticum TaxID=306546 RepID=UPI000411B5FA|nr:EAL domain-containing protein [Marinimicrobium agarilyticum]
MRQGTTGRSSVTPTNASLSDYELLGSALDASDIAVWRLNLSSGHLGLSGSIYEWVPELGPVNSEEQLLALMPPADQYLFQRTFSEKRQSSGPASCEICLAGLASQPRLRFIGRRPSVPEGEAPQFVGAVISAQHWLANPGPEYVQSLLSRLFSESPIASFVTDPDGVMLEHNQALEQLFHLTPRQMMAGIGAYRVLRDQALRKNPEHLERVRRVFQRGEIHCFDLDYPLANLHRNQLYLNQHVPIKVSFLPMRDRYGEVTRVLVQCQDLSGEQSAHRELKHRDQLLYRLINNSHNLVSIKSAEGRYLLVNQSFAQWFDRDPEELCGKTDADLFPAAVAERFRAQERSLQSDEHLPETEEVIPGLDGQSHTFVCVRFPIEGPDGKMNGIGQIMTDISRQKTVEHHLKSQQQELRLLLDSMRSAVWYFDRWGLVKDFNELTRSWFDQPDMKGKSFLEVAPHWDTPAERQRELMQVIRSGKAQLDSIESAQADGAQRWFSVDKIPTKNSQGYVNGVLVVMNDITESVRREHTLAQSEARYRAFIANSSEAIWRYDMEPPVPVNLSGKEQELAIVNQARLGEGNRVLAKILGSPSVEDLLGSGLVETGSQDYRFDVSTFVAQHYELIDHEIVRRDHQGREVHFQISCVGEVEDGALQRVWGTSRDITARKRYEERLEHQATHDALTKLPNRSGLYREVSAWLEDPRDRQAALLLIDLDRFKEINDTLGHQVGDKLLSQIGPRLQSELTELPGLIARLGGDEFAIFLPDIRHHRQALIFGHRVLDALRNEFDLEGYAIEISASIGIALAPEQARDVSTLMRYADIAMYCAKAEMMGVALYEAEKDPHSPKRLSLMNELGRAIRDDQLCLHFQPKIELASRRCYGLEALLRWQHPTMGMISPGEFIPIAEATNLVHPMTVWVLENSIRACCSWHEAGVPLSVAVNLSARNLMDDTLPRQVETLLSRYRLPHWALELEITESSIMTDPRRAMTTLERLHELGVSLSIDDFGTGYSSLAYLKRLPVQTLKIDFSFVRQMLDDEQDEIIVNSTIHLAHNLGLNVVAEGVESEALLLRLQEMGCDLAQGFHIGRPMPAAELAKWLVTTSWVERPTSSLLSGA